MALYEQVKQKLNQCQQSHLLRFFDELSGLEKDAFLTHLSGIKFDEMKKLFERAMESLNGEVEKVDNRMEPIPPSHFECEESCDRIKLEKYRKRGLEEISKGHVGVLLMAGGQGTRLGVTHPKGMFSVRLPSGKTLFRIQAERIRRLQYLAEKQTGRAGKITWYIMTSGPTHEETEEYLQKNNYFGLNEKDVVLFKQGLLPCFDFSGKIILEKPNKVALAPDGNGGIYRALEDNGILDDMDRRGVQFVHAHSVDNILVKVADPVFVGYCIEKGADCGAKVVKKAFPTEAVGVVCKVDNHYQVVEYSEISEETANKRDERGELVFSAGNICNHFFTVNFLREVASKFEKKLNLHVAKKKIPYVDDNSKECKPKAPNGVKIEKFVFDVFQFTNKFVTWEVPRSSEFSALKNSDEVGKDCPSTARRDLLALHKILVERAGGVVHGEVEISPLLSYSGEGLEEKVKGKVFDSYMTVLINADEEVDKLHQNGLITNGK